MSAIRKFNRELMEVSAARGFWLKPLGIVSGYITWLVMTHLYSPHEQVPRVLIVGGFHGEEVAGPWAILKWMQEASDLDFTRFNVSFIPIVNPYGFARNKRYGESGIATNGGFGSNRKQDPSPEGQLLVNNIGVLRPLAENGFMSLHEDNTVRESYIYTQETSEKPTAFTKTLRREMSKHFPKVYDGVAYVDMIAPSAGPECKKGVVYNFFDEGFETLLFQLGVPKTLVTETPGKSPLKKRVEAQVAMINKFLELCEVTHG